MTVKVLMRRRLAGHLSVVKQNLQNLLLDFTFDKRVQFTSMNAAFLTVAQAAEELGVTRQAVQLMIQDERISAEWMLERWAIPATEVARIKKQREQVANGKRKAA